MPATSNRRLTTPILLLLLLLGSGCSNADRASGALTQTKAEVTAAGGESSEVDAASQRKLIRKGHLDLRVASPSEQAPKAQSIVKELGGYVEASERRGEEQADVSFTFRIPSAKLDVALTRLKALAGEDGTISERITTEDVTDRHVDLSARIKAKRKLETRYLALLDKSETMSDTLAIEKQLNQGRTEIERYEGQLTQLDKQVDLSTLELTLQAERPLVTASVGDFSKSVKRASGDAINVGAGIINGGIRLVGIALPLMLFFGVPGWLLGRRLWRFAFPPNGGAPQPSNPTVQPPQAPEGAQ